MALHAELDAEAFERLSPERRAEFLRLVGIAFPPRSRWYCDRPGCDGEPHAGWHWCDHPLPHPVGGEEYWRCRHARWEQHPPEGDWDIWLIQAGRGYGKTRTGAEWVADEAKKAPATAWAAMAPTHDDLVETVFEGESGLLAALGMARADDAYNKTKVLIRLPNGAVIRGLSAERPERTRGPNLAGAWLDEVGVWRYRAAWDDLQPALRRGRARVVVTTTPRPTPLILEWTRDAQRLKVHITRGRMADNQRNLATARVSSLMTQWAGTRRARQELEGELLEDVPGALWRQDAIDSHRMTWEELAS